MSDESLSIGRRAAIEVTGCCPPENVTYMLLVSKGHSRKLDPLMIVSVCSKNYLVHATNGGIGLQRDQSRRLY